MDNPLHRELFTLPPPRNADEALQVLEHMVKHELMDREETNDIPRNLIQGPRDAGFATREESEMCGEQLRAPQEQAT